MGDRVRVRFAPSPTGALHVGGARTAIYNWAFARRNGGAFILRIDDTDPERSTSENTAQILHSLEWLGIDWDEGPEVGGEFGPYFQTGRAALYSAALESMKANGGAYPCFCSIEQLEEKRDTARTAEGLAGYDRTCRSLDPEIVAARLRAGEPHVWRLAVPLERRDIAVEDAVRGTTMFPIDVMDDFVLVRADGTPTYNFATVVDDAGMEISHVIRGDDHLSNTPRQILVYEALGLQPPVFAHLSMIWGPDGKRLSKRHGATSVEAFREEGFLPEALLNYLALLGWSLDGETTIIPPEVLKKTFSLERISKNPAVFDQEKLEWMNGAYIRELPPEDLACRMIPWLEKGELATEAASETAPGWLVALARLVSERLKRLDELAPMVRFLFSAGVEIEPSAMEKVLSKDGSADALDLMVRVLTTLEPWQTSAIEEALRALPEELAMKPKTLFQIARVAISGSMVSLPLFESMELLGREATVSRLRSALALIT
jgi:glutamyl-tRNA synthetase